MPAEPSPRRHAPVTADPWTGLKRFTAARIALGRAGVSQPTDAQLDFALAHARARDAVHDPLDWERLEAALAGLGLPLLRLKSRVEDRRQYLMRPDLGRRLHPDCAALLARQPQGPDMVLVVADGLSSQAVARQAAPFLAAYLPLARARGWTLGPLCLVEGGRVAVGDDIGAALGARCLAVLIGERPGLSSPDSLGVYLTFAPVKGLTDERRNCISNVRPEGLGHAQAAATLDYLTTKAFALGLSGVELKDDRDGAALSQGDGPPLTQGGE